MVDDSRAQTGHRSGGWSSSLQSASYPRARKHSPPHGFATIQRKRAPLKEKPGPPWRYSPDHGVDDVSWYFRTYAALLDAAKAIRIGFGPEHPARGALSALIDSLHKPQNPADSYRAAILAALSTALPGGVAGVRTQLDLFRVIVPLIYLYGASDGLSLPGLHVLAGVSRRHAVSHFRGTVVERDLVSLDRPRPLLRELLHAPDPTSSGQSVATFAHDWAISLKEARSLMSAKPRAAVERGLRELLLVKRGTNRFTEGRRKGVKDSREAVARRRSPMWRDLQLVMSGDADPGIRAAMVDDLQKLGEDVTLETLYAYAAEQEKRPARGRPVKKKFNG